MTSFTTYAFLILTYPFFTQESLFDPKLPTTKFTVSSTTDPVIVTNYDDDPGEAKRMALVNHSAFAAAKSYSGYFTVDKELNSNLFFWFFPSIIDYEKQPVVLWLQGGLGTSFMYGVFEENGPFIVNENGSVSLRPFSWHTYQNLLYIESPVGTGFSYTSGNYSTTMDEVVAHLYNALSQFFKMFPELKTNKFYIAGESFAGRFAPELAFVIHKANKYVSASDIINLKGVLLGNAWFDPVNMCGWSKYLNNLGILDHNDMQEIAKMENRTVNFIKKEKYEKALTTIQSILIGNESLLFSITELLNVHNFMLDDLEYGPYNFEKLIEKKEIQQALHVATVNYSTISEAVYAALATELVKSSASTIERLLKYYRVLFYSGQLDIVVAYPLTVNAIDHLHFDGMNEYIANQRASWYIDERIVGFVKGGNRLTEVLIRNAGHRAVRDQPKYIYDLMYRFIRNTNITE